MDELNAAVMKTKEYSEAEMAASVIAMRAVLGQMADFLRAYVSKQAVPRLEIPVYFVQGKYDINTPPSLAEEYFNDLVAPGGKTWISFDDSAHFPMYEEPRKFLSVLNRAIQ